MSTEDADDVFLRDSSGVIRNVSGADTWIYNIAQINVGIGIAFMIILLGFYPGVNPYISVAFVTVFAAFQTITWYFFSVTMPRTGGSYAFVSRALHPAIGFVVSFVIAFWETFFAAVAATYLGSLGFGPFFALLGDLYGISVLSSVGNALMPPAGTFVSATIPTFIVGTLGIALAVVILSSGMRVYFRTQWITMAIALLGALVLLVVLYTTPKQAFIQNFNQFTRSGLTYQGVIEIARENGYAGLGGSFSWSDTFMFAIWAFYPLAFGFFSSTFAGEIKNVDRNQLLGMPGAVLFTGVFFLLLIYGAATTMGLNFLGAIGYNYFVAPSGATEIMPWVGLLASIGSGNLLVIVLVGLSFLMWSWFWVPAVQLVAARMVLAWSMDRLAPAPLGDVSSKYHTPVKAHILVGVVAEIFLILYLFVPVTQALVAIAGFAVAFAIVGLAAVAFPYTRPEMFENSPISYRIAGIPVMSITGLVTFLFMLFMTYWFMVDPLVGQSKPLPLAIVVGVFVLGFILYYVAKWYRSQQGIDISRAFEEIPVE